MGRCVQYDSSATFLNDGMYWNNNVMKTVNWIVMRERVVACMKDSRKLD